jgi:hypothetical protein
MTKRNPKIMRYFIKKAEEDKAWANRTKDDVKWNSEASDMSKQMLQDNLSKSVQQLAEEKYDYHKHRANLKGMYYGREGYIDPQAHELWKNLRHLK